MPIKPILELIAGAVALVCFATLVKALVELVQMDSAKKRKRRRLQAVPQKKPMSRAS